MNIRPKLNLTLGSPLSLLRKTVVVSSGFWLGALISAQAVDVPAFTHQQISTDKGGRTAIADIDGDGKNDVISASWGSDRGNSSDGKLTWYRYPDWKRTVIENGETLFGDYILTKDFDGDGDIDIMATRKTPAAALIYINNGNGTWRKEVAFEVRFGEDKGQQAADFDGDGKLDVAWRNANTL